MTSREKQLSWALLAAVILIVAALRRPQHAPVSNPVEALGTKAPALPAKTAINRGQPSNAGAVSPRQSPPAQDIGERMQQIQRESERQASLWKSPLIYFGKVVDEKGAPISGAVASYSASSLNETFTDAVAKTGRATTDQRGIFRIEEPSGIGLMVQVSHPDYYAYPSNSTGFDKRDPPRSGYLSDAEERAELFRMHSKGRPVALIFRDGGFHAPSNGTAAAFPLRGQTRTEILSQLQIQGWSNLRGQTNAADWKVRLALPGGGIIEKTNEFEFVAPETGYSEGIELEVSGGESAKREYFLKIPRGYIRFTLEVIMGKDMFVVGEYFFNPDGSRNLEADPSCIIRPTQ